MALGLNLGAGFDWQPIPGWVKVDHNRGLFRSHQAWSIPYPDKHFSSLFCSHMIEHISHFKIEEVLCEMNRVLQPGAVLRLLTPDLKKLATAYVNGDARLLSQYVLEDDSGIRQDLGLGQAFMSFLVSPGYDNFLCDSDLSRPIAGYGHVYSYDFEMLSGLLARYGFGEIRQCEIHDSKIADHKKLRVGPYDKDCLHSLVVECVKVKDAEFRLENCVLHGGPYEIAKIGAQQQWITRPVMRVTSFLDSILYKLVKGVVGTLRPGMVNRRRVTGN